MAWISRLFRSDDYEFIAEYRTLRLSSSQGGKVDISIADYDNENFVVVVRDYGKGISEENLTKIFDPFFTTGRGKGGSGLGLAIVHNIVTTALHGSIEVCSEI